MRRFPHTRPGTAPGAPACSARPPGAGAEAPRSSHRLQPKESEEGHLEQQPAVGEPPNVRGSVPPLLVTDGHFQDLQVELGGPEQQVKVPERVKVPEVPAMLLDA